MRDGGGATLGRQGVLVMMDKTVKLLIKIEQMHTFEYSNENRFEYGFVYIEECSIAKIYPHDQWLTDQPFNCSLLLVKPHGGCNIKIGDHGFRMFYKQLWLYIFSDFYVYVTFPISYTHDIESFRNDAHSIILSSFLNSV